MYFEYSIMESILIWEDVILIRPNIESISFYYQEWFWRFRYNAQSLMKFRSFSVQAFSTFRFCLIFRYVKSCKCQVQAKIWTKTSCKMSEKWQLVYLQRYSKEVTPRPKSSLIVYWTTKEIWHLVFVKVLVPNEITVHLSCAETWVMVA